MNDILLQALIDIVALQPKDPSLTDKGFPVRYWRQGSGAAEDAQEDGKWYAASIALDALELYYEVKQ